MGVLSLPKIEAELVIVEGTNSDDLKKGVVIINKMFIQMKEDKLFYMDIVTLFPAVQVNLKLVTC
ncbi:hypothetical protein A3863_25140 [Priestia endophytica]|nr:hypothetical protein A3863_25140 [Priestia endophytica]